MNSLTTERMMLALANSDRLGEACVLINDPEGKNRHIMGTIGDALTKLVASGHAKEAAKVDGGLRAASPRLSWNREVFDAAVRLAEVGEVDALVRMAETLMLVPGCDRTQTFDIKQEQAMSARTIEMPPIDNLSIPRSTTLLPLLAQAGAMGRFRKLAEARVAAVPEDFKSVRVLTLATLLDTGDDPVLWKRISDAEGFFRGRDFVALKDSMQLCYQLKIPAPHLCASAERIYDESDHYGTSFQRHEFSLMLAALWKDIGRIDESRKWQADALDSLPKEPASACARFFEEYAGVLVVTLDDERMIPELDRWIAVLSDVMEDTDGWGDKYYRHALLACEWALAREVPGPVAGRWFGLADKMAADHLKRIADQDSPEGYSLRWHSYLLLSAGMRGQAQELLDETIRVTGGFKFKDLGLEDQRARLAAAGGERESLVIPDAAGVPIQSVRWTEGSEYLRTSGNAVFIADVYPSVADGGHPLPWVGKKQLADGEDEAEYSTPPPIAGPNLIPPEWRWHRGSTPSDSMVPWENKDGSIRMGYRGGNCGGYSYELWSGSFDLDPEHDHVLSGRIRAYGRGGVSIQFLNADGSIASSQKITEQLSASSPGERWFRVNLVCGSGGREGMRVPQQATAARLVLTNSLSVQCRWSDLFVGRLADVD